jgi:hypothetical protein
MGRIYVEKTDIWRMRKETHSLARVNMLGIEGESNRGKEKS